MDQSLYCTLCGQNSDVWIRHRTFPRCQLGAGFLGEWTYKGLQESFSSIWNKAKEFKYHSTLSAGPETGKEAEEANGEHLLDRPKREYHRTVTRRLRLR